MPYYNISELPRTKTARYSQSQKEAYLKAYNVAYEEHGHDRRRAFAAARLMAEGAGRKVW
jgi:cation transport regulator ChaB